MASSSTTPVLLNYRHCRWWWLNCRYISHARTDHLAVSEQFNLSTAFRLVNNNAFSYHCLHPGISLRKLNTSSQKINSFHLRKLQIKQTIILEAILLCRHPKGKSYVQVQGWQGLPTVNTFWYFLHSLLVGLFQIKNYILMVLFWIQLLIHLIDVSRLWKDRWPVVGGFENGFFLQISRTSKESLGIETSITHLKRFCPTIKHITPCEMGYYMCIKKSGS
jgi:hypothetical protein